jgi:signal transduction histidine kinase/tetratricopeptide (TPR) repeat protein
MKKPRIYTVLLAYILCSTAFSQSREIDSLKQVLNSNVPDTIKLSTLSELSWVTGEKDINLSKEYAYKELHLAQKIADKKWISQGHNDIGIVFYHLGNLDSALFHYNKSYDIRKTLKDKALIASVLSKIGIVEQEMGNYTKALEYQFQVLRIYEELGKENYQAITLNNISQTYDKLKNYDKEIEYGEKSLKIHLKNNNEYNAAQSYGNLASAYKAKGDIIKSNEYLEHALSIFTKYEDHSNVAAVLNSIGLNLRIDKKDSEALGYYQRAYDIAKRINEKTGELLYAHNVSCVLTDLKKYAEAEKYSLEVLENTPASNHAQLALTYRQLATIYGFTNEGKLAKEYLNKYADLKDSVFSANSASQIAEMEVKYQSEKKDLELAKQNAEITLTKTELKRKQILTYSLIGLILVIFLLSYLFYTRYKLKQKAILDAEMLKQQELRAKAIIEAEEKERMRISRDLHDGVGQTLSAAKLNLSSLESKLSGKNIETDAILKNAIDLVDDSVKEVRAVSHSMMPNALLKSGLVAAVREFINKLSTIEKLKIDLEITGLHERLEPSTETVLFRVLQEIVSNIIKHAQANHITIQIVKHETELTIMVEDNGVGFDTKKMNEFNGIGLKNITSRIEFLKGRVDFDSVVGKGTTVVIEVPLEEKN